MWLPLDVVKERMQSQSVLYSDKYKDSIDAVTTIRKKEGTAGLYRSYGGTLAYFGCFSMLYFMLYEKMKKTFNKPD
jgi:hypothetical protein